MTRSGSTRQLAVLAGLALQLVALACSSDARAACGATTRTWNGSSSTTWTTAANWTAADVPNTSTENAVVPIAPRNPTLTSSAVGCFEVQTGGLLNATSNSVTVTVNGDYFRALTTGMLVFTSGRTVTIDLASTTTDQTLEVVDAVNYVTLSTNRTVTFTNPFTIRNTLAITGSGTVLNINANLTLSSAATIPVGATVNVAPGVVVTLSNGLTVNGTLTLGAGSKLLLASGRTLSVGSAGSLTMTGTAGNPAIIDTSSGVFTFTMAGTFSANYFYLSHATAAGLNVSGTVSSLNNGEFHYLATTGVAITVAAGSALPSTMQGLSFFDDSGFANTANFDVAAGYAGNTVTLSNYTGEVSGAAAERNDPNNKIAWGAAAPSGFSTCGENPRVWTGNVSTIWGAAANWTAPNVPNTGSEDPIIVSATRVPLLATMTVGCMEVQSGTLTGSTNGTTLSVKGDYFRALATGSLVFTASRTVTIDMAGAADQTLEVVDSINYVTISNNQTVTFTQPFTLRNDLAITGAGATLNINADLNMTGTNTLTIPAGVTVNVNAGATWTMAGSLTVNGTLTVANGAKLLIASGRTLTVSAGGALQLNGTSGNPAVLDSAAGTYIFNMAGTLSASYFSIAHTTAVGTNVTGTISLMRDGDFHYVATAGVAMTIGATAVLPATMQSVGFYDDSAYNNNFNFSVAAGYTGNTVFLDLYSGDLGGAAREKTDTANKITWGSLASTKLTVGDNTASGYPPASIASNSAATLFGTYSFNLSQSDLATDVTQIKFTMYGTAAASDVSYVRVYKDAASSKNCAYNAGTDTQVGSDLTLSGNPPTATATFAASDVNTNGATQACVHVLLGTSATAQPGDTIGMSIESSADVTNARSGGGTYSFGVSSSPPIRPGKSTITGTVSVWDGSSTTAWATAANWTPATLPSSTQDCKVGSGTRIPALTANQACRNTTLQTGGTLDFSSGTWQLQTYGSLSLQPSFTFNNATTGVLAMLGASAQSISGGTTFPGDLMINNSADANVTVDADATFTGNLTVTRGNLRVSTGKTLTIGGNIVVQTGATLTVDAGGTLKMSNGRSLTVNSGGTLALVGSASNTALVTLASGASGYSIVVNGTIKAKYYTVDRMGLAGLTINSGATIDATHSLLNGSFTNPMVNSTVMLTLNRQVPGNAMSNMVFDANGSSATGVTNIKTSTSAGTLTITTYSGTLSGPTYTNAPAYVVSWVGATNTINVTQELTGPLNVNQGTTYTMGRFGFKQNQAGGSFVDSNITSLTLTLTGTGSSSDVSAVRLYYDSACSGSGGTQLGSAGTFSGNPATVTFAGISAAVPAHATSTPMRCIYVQYDVASNAVNAKTLGAKINANSDLVNSQNYAVAAGTPLPVTLGSAAAVVGSSTTWVGTTNTDFCTASNWSGGLPTSALNCAINSSSNNPMINGTTCTVGTCKSVTINSGTLTIGSAGRLKIHGSLTSTATFVNSGTLELADGGTAINQTITGIGSIGTVTFSKTGGGTARAAGTTSISTLTIPTGSVFEWVVAGGDTLTLTNGLSLTPAGAVFNVQGGGTLRIPSAKSISVAGGTFKISGTNDVYPQATGNKGKVTNNGVGTWSFSATSGTVDLTGWILDKLDTNGLVLGGTTVLAHLDGGQFTNLSAAYPVKALQINTSGSIPATATNVGWNWGAANSTYNAPPSPDETDNYLLASSTGCANHSISFDQWFGDFHWGLDHPVTTTKISAASCSITIAASASPVTLTSLAATPYDGAISLDWETGAELDHAGFNVYRSMDPSTGYVQVNPRLIRNLHSSATLHGIYRFVDTEVVNGLRYYYRVEDISYSGIAAMHGPVWAVPDASHGNAPGTASGTNSDTAIAGADTGNGVSTGAIATPDVIDLGNGVHLLAQTQGSLRVEIIPPAITFAASSWNGSYQTIGLPGYATTLEAGKPELVERTILIEVDPSKTTAALTAASVQEAAPSSHLIAPVPSYALVGSTLVPSYSPDAAAYSLNASVPAAFHSVAASLQKIGGKNFVSIKATPVIYNAATQQLRFATRIVLDIGLDGAAWSTTAPAAAIAASPSAVEGTLRIRYVRTGMYELGFDDIVAAGLDGFLAGATLSNLRLYVRGKETPIQVVAAGATFASGDRLRFYLPYIPGIDDTDNEAVLATVPLASSSGAPLRMQHLSGDPTSAPSSDEAGTFAQARVEQDLFYLQDIPLGIDGVDHFYWKRIAQTQGMGVQAGSTYSIPIDLPNLIQASDAVRVRVYGRGRGALSVNPTHHVGVLVNTTPFVVADKALASQQPSKLDFTIPSTYFVPGTNTVKIRALGDLVPSGDTDIFDIDRVEVDYRASRSASADSLLFYSHRPGAAAEIEGFSNSAITIFDTTEPDDVLIVDGAQATSGGGTFGAVVAANVGANEDRGYRYIAVATGGYLAPTALKLGRGANIALKSSSPEADLLIVGPRSLLDAAQELVEQRRSEGLRVVTASLDQVYAEFGDGTRSSQAIRELVRYAAANWAAPAPRYLLLLGDATYDPRDRFEYGSTQDLMPVFLQTGTFGDFASDNWFVSEDSGMPVLAVGRIPARHASEVSGFVTKLLAYERGDRAPTTLASGQMTVISDTDQNGEGFAGLADQFASSVRSLKTGGTTSRIDRTAIASDPATHAAIVSAFGQGPFGMTYVGHGAEDLWADSAVFTAADASGLTNTRLPFVMALNCLNAYFYDADPEYKGLGESLVLNPSGGAIGFWGSTTMTAPAVQYRLAMSFLSQFAQETNLPPHVTRLGDLALRAKVAVGYDASTRDALRSYILIGDPSTRVPLNAFTGTIEPDPTGSGSGSSAAPAASGASGAPGASSSSAASSSDSSSKGFLGCGTVSSRNGRDGDGGGPGSGAAGAAEFGLLMALMMATRLRSVRRALGL